MRIQAKYNKVLSIITTFVRRTALFHESLSIIKCIPGHMGMSHKTTCSFMRHACLRCTVTLCHTNMGMSHKTTYFINLD
jgi:hypothetical protein